MNEQDRKPMLFVKAGKKNSFSNNLFSHSFYFFKLLLLLDEQSLEKEAS